MPADRDDLRRLIQRARERGMDDDAIRALARRYVERSTTPAQPDPVPASLSSPFMLAPSTPQGDPVTDQTPRPVRGFRLDESLDNLGPRKYAAGAAANIGPSAINTAINMAQGLGSAANTIRRTLPGQGTEEDQQRARELITGFVPGIIEHYRTRLGSPERILRTMHDDPVGGILDISPVLAGKSIGPAIGRGARTVVQRVPGAASATAEHVANNAGLYGGLGSAATGGEPFSGWLAGKAIEKFGDWWRNRPAAQAAGAAADTAAGQSTLDQMLRDIIGRRDPALWEDSPYAPPRPAPQPPVPQLGAPPPSPPALTVTPPAPAQDVAAALEGEVRKRVPQTVDPRLYAPARYLDTDLVSIKANQARNMGALELAGESYPQLRVMLEEAVKAGDVPRAIEIRKRISQRRQQTEAAIKRGD